MKYISQFFYLITGIAGITAIVAAIHLLFSISDDEKKWDRQNKQDEADYKEMLNNQKIEMDENRKYWENLQKEDVERIHAQIDYKIQKIKNLLNLGPQTPAMIEIPEDCFIALHEKGMFKESIRDK